MTNQLRVISSSPAAKTWLQNSEHIRVLHNFAAVVNLINSEKSIISLVTTEIGDGPFNLVLDISEFSISSDSNSEIILRDSQLLIGGFAIDHLDIPIWNPIPGWKELQTHKEDILKSIKIINTILSNEAPEDSIAKIINLPQNNDGSIAGNLAKTISNAVALLSKSILETDPNSLREAAKILAGLGIGLTPAGDDFLVGVIYGFWAAYLPSKAHFLSQVIVKAAAKRTNELSSAWLQAAANGEASELWHQLITSIIRQDEELLRGTVQRILPTGHTSGADALGGFTFTLSKLLR